MKLHLGRINESGISALIGLLILAFLLACVFTGYKVYDSRHVNSENSSKTTTSGSTTKNTITANFYDNIKIGMAYDQVVALAGGDNGVCEYSGAPAPTDYMNCTWPSGPNNVTVSFKNHLVTTKSQKPSNTEL